MEEKIIRPFYHMHPLVLKEKVMSGTKRVESCYGCRKPVADSEMAYVCTEADDYYGCSDMILHKKCGELPSEIDQHPKHPHHPIRLSDYHSRRGYSSKACNVCRCDLEDVLGYRCNSCDFDIDITCEKIGIDAFSEERRKELLHPSHPSHPLTLIRKHPLTFYCDGCGAEGTDMAYICSTCEVMIHKGCAALSATVRTDQHHHRLSLAFSFPEKHLKFVYKCEVCDKLLDLTCWLYYCDDCRYFVHIKCVIAVGSSTSKFPDTSNLNEDGGDAIEFPLDADDIFHKLIKPFVMREKGVINTISTSSSTNTSYLLEYYHEHPLRYVSEFTRRDDGDDEEKDDEEEDIEEELKICDVCITPISNSSYYECATSTNCTYSIHSICSLLPHTLQHSSSSSNTNSSLLFLGECRGIANKNHNFTLYTSKGRDAIMRWTCELCRLPTNGMGYKCGDCGKKIDVKCASLPATIRHASHTRRHHKPLILSLVSPTTRTYNLCHVCNIDTISIRYYCSQGGCDFSLHLKCAMLPLSIKDREWDKHSLLLTSDASLDHPSDFFCEFCEQEMHPKNWMYHCRHCDASFHLNCLDTGSGFYRNMKFGRRFEFKGIHPNHPLTFTCVTLKKHCDLCHKRYFVYTWLGFECATCYYVLCWDCGVEEYRKKNQMSLC